MKYVIGNYLNLKYLTLYLNISLRYSFIPLSLIPCINRKKLLYKNNSYLITNKVNEFLYSITILPFIILFTWAWYRFVMFILRGTTSKETCSYYYDYHINNFFFKINAFHFGFILNHWFIINA
jgi:hypothetical protein